MAEAAPGPAPRDTLRPWGDRIAALAGVVVGVELRRFVLWLPVLMALGIWVYIGAAREPPDEAVLLPLLPAAALAIGSLRRRAVPRALAVALLAVSVGHALAQASAWRAAMPVIAAPFAATVEGRVVTLDRAASGAPRVLLDRVTAFGRRTVATPPRVRVTLSAMSRAEAPRPGDWIRVYATLLTPRAPVEPGAFDFARRAYFDRIGAIGFARAPAVAVPARELAGERARTDLPGIPDRTLAALDRMRLALADDIRLALPGPTGAFAAAILVGDRAAIDDAHAEALRISSLAHLLAISGLHMGLLTGLVFAAIRLALALTGGATLRLPGKKVAAAAALGAGLAYLALSGATVATQRAFVMVAVALTAVMLDRPAITLRAVALAAVIVLAIRPVSLFDPGFQMSFAATTALVAAFAAWRERRPKALRDNHRPAWQRSVLRWAGALVASSVIAGLATAPVAAVHFHRLTPFGLFANLLAVPVMGLWIMPAAVLAALLAPLGLAAAPLGAMGIGIDWVLGVATSTASLPGADARLAASPAWILGALGLAGLWLTLWRGPWRLLGAVACALAAAAWAAAPVERPVLLVAQNGSLVGLMTTAGRVLDRTAGQGYTAERWLARDGDGAAQRQAALRPGFQPPPVDGARPPARLRGWIGEGPEAWEVIVLRGRVAAQVPCARRQIVIAPALRGVPRGDCAFIGRDLLSSGAVAVRLGASGPEIASSRPEGGRPWHRRDQR